MFNLEAWLQISHISTRPTQEGVMFSCSKALVICGFNAVSKNYEQKGVKVALMALNLIGIPCQVWPWEDISHSTSDCACAYVCVCEWEGAHMCLQFSFMKRSGLNTVLFCQCNCGSEKHSLRLHGSPVVFLWECVCVCVCFVRVLCMCLKTDSSQTCVLQGSGAQ